MNFCEWREKRKIINLSGPRNYVGSLHFPCCTRMKSHRHRAIKVSRNAPKATEMLFICISIENAQVLEVYLITLLKRCVCKSWYDCNKNFGFTKYFIIMLKEWCLYILNFWVINLNLEFSSSIEIKNENFLHLTFLLWHFILISLYHH